MKSIQIVALAMTLFFSFESYSQSKKPVCRSKQEAAKITYEIQTMNKKRKKTIGLVEFSDQVRQVDKKSIKAKN